MKNQKGGMTPFLKIVYQPQRLLCERLRVPFRFFFAFLLAIISSLFREIP